MRRKSKDRRGGGQPRNGSVIRDKGNLVGDSLFAHRLMFDVGPALAGKRPVQPLKMGRQEYRFPG
jgi:hypothetical protein